MSIRHIYVDQLIKALLVCAAVGLIAVPSQATVVVFTNQAAWESAAGLAPGGGAGSGFENEATQQFAAGTTSLTDFDVTISGNSRSLNGIETETSLNDLSKSGQYYEGYVSNVAGQTPTSIQWDFPSPLTAWGGMFGQANNSGTDPGADPLGGLEVTINGQSINLANYLGDAPGNFDNGFIGFVENMGGAFSQMTFSQASAMTTGPSAAEYFTIDHIATAVPEPSAALLIVGCSLALLGRRRRKV